LPSQVKVRPDVTQQQIDLENYSNPLKTSEVLRFRMKQS